MQLAQYQTILPKSGINVNQVAVINAAMFEFGIGAPFDQAAWIANVGHETGQLLSFSENLNYSAERLLVVWPTRFTPELAMQLQHKPEAIANHVYANRFGNGDESSGDGWRFRGAGGIQLTFHDNMVLAAEHFGMDVGAFAEWARTFDGAMRSAAWYWKTRNISAFAAAGDFDGCCDRVNIGRKTEKVGDSIGYAGRLALFNVARKVLSC